MAHFAKIENNIVVDVLVVNNDVCGDTFPESEPVGQDFIVNILGFDGEWKQASYNHNFRKQYPYPGYIYDSINNVFIEPSPYPSWTMDDNFDWHPPTPLPSDNSETKRYTWDEEQLLWVELSN